MDTATISNLSEPDSPPKRQLLDDGISIRCLTTALRHKHTRRAASGCQIKMPDGGGSVGCPDCPYGPKRIPFALK